MAPPYAPAGAAEATAAAVVPSTSAEVGPAAIGNVAKETKAPLSSQTNGRKSSDQGDDQKDKRDDRTQKRSISAAEIEEHRKNWRQVTMNNPKTTLGIAWHTFIILAFCIFPFGVYPPLAIAAVYLLYLRYGFMVLYFAAMLVTISWGMPPYYTDKFRKNTEWAHGVFAYYAKSFRYVVPTKKFPEAPYIFACHPHGRMFYSFSLFMALFHRIMDDNVPSGDVSGAISSALFALPFLRNWFYLLGLTSASRRNLYSRLCRGNHVGILVGGVKEICEGTTDHEDVLYIKRRVGFLKLAMDTSAGVVPVYFFGENQIFKHESKAFLNFWRKVNSYISIGVPMFRGWCNLPIPFRRDLLIAVGEPLFAKEGESPEQFHARYVAAVEDLFYTWVGCSFNPSHRLRLV
eukprot:jgi/Chlat1/7644/Chrsp64S07120